MDNRIDLDKNENFFEFSNNVIKSVEHFDFEELRKYPKRNALNLCDTIADIFSLESENVLVANGRYEIFTYILNIFARNREVIISYPTSDIYSSLCKRFDIKHSTLNASYDYTINLDNVNKEDDSLIIISNPNSTTGAHIPVSNIEDFLDSFKGILVIDEAYSDFSLSSSYMLTKKYNNLMVVRSLSYSHSLAGLRLAFVISDKNNIDKLYTIKDPYNVNTLTQIIADVSIRNTTAVKNNILALINERTFLDNELSRLGFLVLPSKANFLLVRPLLFKSIDIYNYLLKENIIVKKYDNDRLKEYLRITVGERKDNVILVSKIKTFIKTITTK